ncbi:hypothetical protein [Jeotgalibacillus sp. R-1-5s-1]|uniref:hypothetical protein n=1 Tax=Jeotgalibacillus sp. R-1-5s-1 TaxID=2555897 RepID=UPI00141A8EE4|nr:hypothetical protein [Jeotgalibacillus sp. R-1-5s-1]
MEWFFPVIFLVGFAILSVVTKKNTKKGNLSRKGFYQFIGISILLFVLAAVAPLFFQ